MKPNNVYKPAALAYLNQWYEVDRQHVRALQADDIAMIGTALLTLANEYSVGRGLGMQTVEKQRRKDELLSRLQDIANELKPISTEPHQVRVEDVWQLGVTIGQKFKRRYGNKEVNTNQLSAASKFLWFAGAHHVRIFDSQAYAALYKRKPPYGKMSVKTYVDFCARWNTDFKQAESLLDEAIAGLATKNMLEWSVVPSNCGDEILAELAKPWFKARVYDKHLWIKGAEELDRLERAAAEKRAKKLTIVGVSHK